MGVLLRREWRADQERRLAWAGIMSDSMSRPGASRPESLSGLCSGQAVGPGDSSAPHGPPNAKEGHGLALCLGNYDVPANHPEILFKCKFRFVPLGTEIAFRMHLMLLLELGDYGSIGSLLAQPFCNLASSSMHFFNALLLRRGSCWEMIILGRPAGWLSVWCCPVRGLTLQIYPRTHTHLQAPARDLEACRFAK